jgi:pimeloyl-ACP methyl ester carboxylesterase
VVTPDCDSSRMWGQGVATGAAEIDLLGQSNFAVMPAGNRVHYYDSLTSSDVCVLLVHGAMANSAWWIDVEPILAARYRVITVDLSGHGRSDHCDTYRPHIWADELTTLLLGCGVTTAHLVGHSMGGRVCTVLAGQSPKLARALTLIDTPFQRPQQAAPRGRPRGRPQRTFASAQEAIEHFRLRPDEPYVDADRLREVARRSIKQTEGGWTWSSDPNASQLFTDEALEVALRTVGVPVSMIRAEHSPLVGQGTIEYLEQVLASRVIDVVVEGAYHHIPLGAPTACAEAIVCVIERSAPDPEPADVDSVDRAPYDTRRHPRGGGALRSDAESSIEDPTG